MFHYKRSDAYQCVRYALTRMGRAAVLLSLTLVACPPPALQLGTFTLTYDGNGATGGSIPAQPRTYTEGDTVAVLENTGNLSKPGYAFAGWDEWADGRGPQHTAGSTFTMHGADVTLYAMWSPLPSGPMWYLGNGNTAGTEPTDPATYVEGQAVTILGPNNLARAGYSFGGWNTKADGTGVTYQPGGTLTKVGSIMYLWAVWTSLSQYHVHYYGNGQTGGTEPVDPTGYAEASTVTLLGPGTLVKGGYAFAGWNTSFDGSGTGYAQGSSYTMGTADLSLYAQWAAGNLVTFDASGGAGSMGAQMIAVGDSAPLMANSFNRAGYAFAGWALSPGGALAYADQASYTMGASSVTLYARWTPNNNTITFNANGGTGSMSAQTMATDATALLRPNAFTRAGYGFAGWALTPGGALAYPNQASYTMGPSNVTLYAVWTPQSQHVSFYANGGTGSMADQIIAMDATAALHLSSFLKTGYTFAGWATSGTGPVVYPDGADLTMTTLGIVLYAKWTANNNAVTFMANGGSGSMTAQIMATNTTAALNVCTFTRTGWLFTGWATSAYGTVAYADGAGYTMGTSDVTLYATWSLRIDAYAGTGANDYTGDSGEAALATFSGPRRVAYDASRNLYIADTWNFVVRKISTGGVITTFAGNHAQGYSGDGGPATSASFGLIMGVAVDGNGDVYVSDFDANRVRKIDTSGKVSTVAGNGTGGYGGDGGPATSAALWGPDGLAFDASGNLYIADTGNGRIRKVDTSGYISTVAGGGAGGDGGPATSAWLNLPEAVAFDPSGFLYVADTGSGKIRKVDGSGTISTVAGGGVGTTDGIAATLASLSQPEGFAFDASGDMFIAVGKNVLMVDTAGVISTVAGTAYPGDSGDGGPATLAQLSSAIGLAFDASGDLLVTANNRIRKLTMP